LALSVRHEISTVKAIAICGPALPGLQYAAAEGKGEGVFLGGSVACPAGKRVLSVGGQAEA
jgi:hypothetical protein